MAGGEVVLVDLVKRFGDVTAVAGINLSMPSGEFFSLLGPSGCGKTTTLRLIAGFEAPDEGQILLDGVDMAQTRRTSATSTRCSRTTRCSPTCPSPTTSASVSGTRTCPSRMRSGRSPTRSSWSASRASRSAGHRSCRADSSSGSRSPERSSSTRPCLLLDEPLGALDAKLRKALQIELKALQEEIGITFIYVTHDQEEALTMSDRLAVMSDGRVEQIGSPSDVYEEPTTAYVADFLGVSNLMDAQAEGSDGDGRGKVRLGEFELGAGQGDTDARGAVKIVIRPERVRLEESGSAGENRVPGMVERVVYVGSIMQVIVHLAPGPTLQAWVQNQGEGLPYAQGHPVSVHLPVDALRVLVDASTVESEGGGQEDTAA